MSKPAKPAAAKKDDAAGAPPHKSNKLLIIIIAVLVLIIAGAAGWWFTIGKNAGHAEAPKVEAPKDPKFIPLDAFTVNLAREESDQFLQVNISLKILEPELEEKIKAVLPEIRSKLNLLLSSKRPSELATAAGKKKLAADIMAETNTVLGIHNGADAHGAAHPPEPVAVSAPVAVVSEVAATGEHEKPAEEAAAPEHSEAASAPVAETHAPAPVHAAPAAGPEKKGVVDVLFTSFIIQ